MAEDAFLFQFYREKDPKGILRTYQITITGLVQGVGFRPLVYRIARQFNLHGWVNNTNVSLQVRVNAGEETLKEFIREIRAQAPPVSRIESVECDVVAHEAFKDFRITGSENLSEAITRISPDIAVCRDCLSDMKQQPGRIDYPFVNCTNCGPRFTIVEELPYDRSNTTMKKFAMCDSCRKEYEDMEDRRFHAQPVACSRCGPEYTLVKGEKRTTQIAGILSGTASLIEAGKTVAVKGLGGFFLACNALDQEAVGRLRESKHREGKPFAVMFAGLDRAIEYCELGEQEIELLTSWKRPIVIAREKRRLAPGVSNGFPTIGAMLPYMPFHYLLFEKLNTPAVVMTSGNLSEEPIITDNSKAEEVLGPISDAVLHYNRDIRNRTDDSVSMVVNGQHRILRRSRGYVPNPVRLSLKTEGIFAAGAELVNCFCMGKGNEAILSQHIGDLKNYETYAFYRETFQRYSKTFRMEPGLVAHDLHPDYLSTQFAVGLGLPAVPVQHHHAHIASVMAEHGLDEKVIGVSFDGTGLGDDNHIWGSEFLLCDLAGYERISHLEYMPMPGGDKAVREPWRMAVACLYASYGRDMAGLDLPFLRSLDMQHVEGVIRAIEEGINCPLTSGAGRLFDAVSAMLDICKISLFHAEAPMRLEGIAARNLGDPYPYVPGDAVDVRPMIRNIAEDIRHGTAPELISGRFHNTIADLVMKVVLRISKGSGIKKVALSGGTFQNRVLSTLVENRLREKGFTVYVPVMVPVNDGGIALGQMAVAAKLR